MADKPEEEAKKEAAKLKEAMVRQFNQTYGKHEHDLASWQKLCATLGTNPVPSTIAKCRKVRYQWCMLLLSRPLLADALLVNGD